MRCIFLLLVCYATYASGQELEYTSLGRNISGVSDAACGQYYTELANRDVITGKMRLFEIGGLWHTRYTTDSTFERKYNIRYDISGCIRPDQEHCLAAYNKVIFRHLNDTYGRRWKRTVRPNVIGRPRSLFRHGNEARGTVFKR